MRIKFCCLLFVFFLLQSGLFAQEQQFRGQPWLIEETSWNEAEILYITVYRFGAEGKLLERWTMMPDLGRKRMFEQERTTLEYENNRLIRTTDYDKDGNFRESLEFVYNEQGRMTGMRKVHEMSAFNFDSAIQTDSLGRIVQVCTSFSKKGRASDCRKTEYFGDTLMLNTQTDESGAIKSIRRYQINEHGFPRFFVETGEKGDTVYRSEMHYEYDPTGNWLMRNRKVASTILGEYKVDEMRDIRRIVYHTEKKSKKLTAQHLEGRWADFLTGIDLEFRSDGSYLAYTHGRRKDGGRWTLDTRGMVLLVTGKEHKEPESMDYQFDGRTMSLYPPGNRGVIRLVKLD